MKNRDIKARTEDSRIYEAIGRYVLNEISLGRAAEIANMSRWEFEELISDSEISARYGPTSEEELDEEIKSVLDTDGE